jgi:N-methylhydantoinase B
MPTADGLPGILVINPGTDREVVLTDRVTTYGPLEVGDVLSARSGGGGGYGHDPRHR